MALQLTFNLPTNVRQGANDFFVSEANELAYALLQSPSEWPSHKLALIGPAGSGKTHLAQVFAEQHGATILNATDIRPDHGLPDGPLVVEDGEGLPSESEEWLFHAHNTLARTGRALLITGQTPPARWSITLPDLASRLSAATTAVIQDPDDDLLTAVMFKQFQDRQLIPATDAVSYLLKHLPRTFAALRDIIETLDREALAQSKELTRPFVRSVLDRTPLDG